MFTALLRIACGGGSESLTQLPEQQQIQNLMKCLKCNIPSCFHLTSVHRTGSFVSLTPGQLADPCGGSTRGVSWRR